MDEAAEPNRTGRSQLEPSPSDKAQETVILAELKNVLKSQAFRTSKRSQEFLSHVVNLTLEKRIDLLKERTIGVELFHRPASYSTGDDGVVRVQAGEVRRRLKQHYGEPGTSWEVRIDLPVGSYVPEFQWNHDTPAVVVTSPPASVQSTAATALPQTPQPSKTHRGLKIAALAVVGVSMALALVIIPTRQLHVASASDSSLEQFWAPVLSKPQPVLICVPKPVVYLPGRNLYEQYSKSHPTEFQTLEDRFNKPLPLDPKQLVQWGDMVEAREFGIDVGDACVAIQLATLFARMNKVSQVKVGSDYSFADLRASPAVLVGAFDNSWTLRMTSGLRFIFAERGGQLWIEDRNSPGKGWSLNPRGQVVEDFGIVDRLLDSKTGQTLFATAGIGKAGTQAAGEFISTGQDFRECLRDAPSDWQKKDMQVVVQTTVIDTVAGPPHVVATHFW